MQTKTIDPPKVLTLHNPFGRQLLTPAEAAYATGYKKTAIRYWIQVGYLHRYGTARALRVHWDQLAELMTNPPKLKPGGGPGPKRKPIQSPEERKRELSLLDAALAGMKAEVKRAEGNERAAAREDVKRAGALYRAELHRVETPSC